MRSVRRVKKTDKNNENIEKISSFTESKESEAGKSIRPHFRRGHWHTYWLGKRTAKDRKLVLRWVAPIMVNISIIDELPVVVNRLK